VIPRRSPRASLVVALVLALIGAGRLLSDFLTDADPGWSRRLDGTPLRWLRYLVRAPSDGTRLGDLNVQWFKVLAIPCCIAGLWLIKRVTSSDLRDTERLWRSRGYRGSFLALFAAMCVAAELEKTYHFLGLRMAGQLQGERPLWNHVAHAVSLAAGAWLMSWLCFAEPTAPRARRRSA
jgi:hypothetical protein